MEAQEAQPEARSPRATRGETLRERPIARPESYRPYTVIGPGGGGGAIDRDGRRVGPSFPIGPGGVVGRPTVNGEDLPATTDGVNQLPMGGPPTAANTRSMPFWNPNDGGDQAMTFPIGPGAVTTPDYANIGARNTGVPEVYSRALFQQEGGGNPDARNARSTATGVTQFIEGTWLQVLHDYGEQYGLPREMIDQIERNPRGGWRVRSADAREHLLALRFNPRWNALMSGHYANQEVEDMARRAGRPVSVQEAYLAHFMNGNTAGAWVRALGRGEGNTNARQMLRRIYARNPGQAASIIAQNPSIFTEDATVESVYARQVGDFRENGVRQIIAQEESRRGSPYSREERNRRETELRAEFRRIWGRRG